jgi:hypothetical protein
MRTSFACVLSLLAACANRPLDDMEPEPMPSAQCAIDDTAPDDVKRLDLALTVRSRCAHCGPVTLRVAQGYPLEQGRASRWLAKVVVDYGTVSTRACEVVEAALDYPALIYWADVDRNGRCDPGIDRGAVDQRYGFCCRDEQVSVDVWGSPTLEPSMLLGPADAALCALLPRS